MSLEEPGLKNTSSNLGRALLLCVFALVALVASPSPLSQPPPEQPKTSTISGTVVSLDRKARILFVRLEVDGQWIKRRFIGTSTTDIYQRVVAPEQDEAQDVRLMLDWEDLERGTKVSLWYEPTNARNLVKSIEIHK
jgi:hypothetical protein